MGEIRQKRRYSNPHQFYRNLKLHLIEIASIASLVIVLYKMIRHEW